MASLKTWMLQLATNPAAERSGETLIEKPLHVEPSRPLADETPSGNGSQHPIQIGPPRVGRPMILGIIGTISAITILAFIPSVIQKWLWMRQVGYAGIFWTLFSVQWELFCAAFVAVSLYLWINLRLAAKNGASFRAGGSKSESALATRLGTDISPTVLKLVMGAVAAFAALFFAVIFYTQWDTYLRFRYGGSFGLSDPLFGADAGFYVFRLPFYELLQSSVTTLAAVALLAVLVFYAYFGVLEFSRRRPLQGWSAKAVPHLSSLLFFLVASWGWGFYLDHYELLYSTQGVVYGAGYTADHVTRIAYWIMAGAAAALCALLVLNIFRPRFRAIVIGSGIYVALYFIAVLLAAGPLSEVQGTAERAGPRNPVSQEQHRVHPEGLQPRHDPGNILPGAGGSDARGDCEKSRHDPEHPSLGLPPVASDVPTSPGDTALLSVLPG